MSDKDESPAKSISTFRRRRGVVKASLTKLTTQLAELESKSREPTTLSLAQRLATKLEPLDSDFKTHHYNVVDMIPEDGSTAEIMAKEQEELDNHDSNMTDLSLRFEKLLRECSSSSESPAHQIASRSLTNLKERLHVISSALTKLKGGPEEAHLIGQYQEHVSDLKKELTETRRSILSSLTLKESETLIGGSVVDLDKTFFDIGLTLKKLAVVPTKGETATTDSTPDGGLVKLPKLEIPTFDGNLLQWLTFWEQFRIAIHDRSDLSQAQKLVYLQQSLKDGSAKNAIEGLSRSGEQYNEAVKCLQERFDRPRLIHQAHVRKIVEAPGLKDGTGRELRRLHDVLQQHLRALKAMGKEPSASFITSLIEMKLDQQTMFEWQRDSQDSTDVPHYTKLLEFLNHRAQASESSTPEQRKGQRNENPTWKKGPPSRSTSFITNVSETNSNCILCKTEKHPLYACTRFKALPRERMIAVLKENNLCMNCLKFGHFLKQCPSLSKCRKCQKPHHTLIHFDPRSHPDAIESTHTEEAVHATTVETANVETGFSSNTLLMTCQVLVHSPDGTTVKARALLDSASSTSFVAEHLVQVLHLPRSSQSIKISGITGMSHHSPLHSVVNFDISSTSTTTEKIPISAVAVPRVTNEIPLQPVHLNSQWSHLTDLHLADPEFGRPGRIDILLGVDIYADVVMNGRRIGPPGSPVAFQTKFGWVLAGRTRLFDHPQHQVTSNFVSVASCDDLLRKFWEIEENPRQESNYSPEEKLVVDHFQDAHARTESGRFVVPLPKKPHAKPLGESRTQAVRRFLSLERSLNSKDKFKEFADVVNEYFELSHAEAIPAVDLQKPPTDVFYLPMHAVHKEHSTTTKLRVVFDASAKSTTGMSLNDRLLVGPTVHPPLLDVLLRFRFHRVALTADVSKMYRAVELVPSDRDLHRFVWRKDPSEPLKDYRMTRVTFGVSASSFAANMSVKQNALDFSTEYPLAAEAVMKSFYVDDCLSGADNVNDAIKLQTQLQDLFAKGGFLLRKWSSSDPSVLCHLSAELKDAQSMQALPNSKEYTKTLGIEWNVASDHFRLTISSLPPLKNVTKRLLVSDVAKTFDILGWFSPSTIKVKVLLQQLWESRVDWDDTVPPPIHDAWLQWRSELPLLSDKHIARCYFDKSTQIISTELHGFCDASELAYAAVVYLRLTDSDGKVQVTLVTSKSKVAPIKRLTIPRLELCGAHLLAHLLHHVRQVFEVPLNNIYAWTDSTIVLNWLDGNPRRFKTYVGNRISTIISLIPPEKWNHVNGLDNPADCASRGLFPSELLRHELWWNGPSWLRYFPDNWPQPSPLPPNNLPEEEKAISMFVSASHQSPIIPLDRYSSYNRLKRITAWMFRFVHKCRKQEPSTGPLSTQELLEAEHYWIKIIQQAYFSEEIASLTQQESLTSSSPLVTLNPFVDSAGLLRVGGRQQLSNSKYESKHPIILASKHPVTRIIIRTEHLRLLHAGPTLLSASLSLRYHIVGGRNCVRSITRECVTCRRRAVKPQPQLLGQLPIERVTPGPVFQKVGVDYAGPVLIKYGHVRKPTVVKAYICVFVSLTVKAVHLELVSDLTTDAFIACLRRFISRRGLPSVIWSDHGTNFVGAAREIKDLYLFLKDNTTQNAISKFLSTKNINWKFIPQHGPHFGGLWEAAVKSMKTHLRKVVGNVKLTFEEMSTLLVQVESCLNSRPLVSLPSDDDGIEALTPGHFLIGQPLQSLPDDSFAYAQPISTLRRWQLCQALLTHFWKRWCAEYITNIGRFTKWRHPTRNIQVGDIVILRESSPLPSNWPLARVIQVHPGKDNLVRVATVKTVAGTYTRPVTKLALLLPSEVDD